MSQYGFDIKKKKSLMEDRRKHKAQRAHTRRNHLTAEIVIVTKNGTSFGLYFE